MPRVRSHLSSCLESDRLEPNRLAPETTLDSSDIEQALRRMKQGLALLDLRRALLTRAQDASTVLSLTDRILKLQAASS